MSKSFLEALRAIVGSLAPAFREQGERDIQALLQAGAKSLPDLRTLCSASDADADLRATACWALGRLGDQGAVTSLLRALDDSDARVRAQSAHALGEIAAPETVERLGRMLTEDVHLDAREEAAWALGALGAPAAVEPLLAVLADGGASERLRGTCAEALGELGDERALSPLIVALSDPCAEVRFFAASALGHLGDRRALPALETVAAGDDGVAGEWGAGREEALVAIEAIEARGAAS